MTKQLKIVHVTPDLRLGGGGVKTFLQNLFRCLRQEEAVNIILTNQSEEPDRQDFQALGIPVCSRLMQSQSIPGNILEITQWMIKALQQLQPDIVHTHLFWGDTLGRQAAVRAGVPIIVTTEHNTNVDENENHRKIKRRLAQVTDCVICVSKAVRTYSREIDQIPDDLLITIHNSIIFEDYQFQGWVNSKATNKFVYVGRLEPQKNPLLLLDAFTSVAIAHPECHLSIIGNGSLMELCQTYVNTQGLSEQVDFLGYQQKPWLRVPKGSVFVLPSNFEGFGIVVLEAMASGHLCILPSVGGLPEIAKANSEVLFYPAGNQDKLSDAMQLALDMPETQRLSMVKAARMRVERDFNAHVMANKYLNIYQTLYSAKIQKICRENAISH